MSVYEDIKTGLEQAIAYEKENNTKKEKAILVIDMPSGCDECKIRFDDDYSNWYPYDNPEPGGVWEYTKKGTKPDWCPLKPAPEKCPYKRTNADRMRSMNDEELAEWLVYKVKCTGCNAENCDEEFCLNLMNEWIKNPCENILLKELANET